MIEYLQNFANEGKEINAKEMFAMYNLDVICSTGFGIESKSFTDPENKMMEMVYFLFYSNVLT